jgi:alkylglycerol monooxygenase
MAAYLYIYNNWRIYELPWDSAVTWVVAAILCDLGYYWVHRAAHGKLVSSLFSVFQI